MSSSAPPERSRPGPGAAERWRAIALGAILVLAGVLRFTGLGWGLRHTPHWDERVFVENAVQMVAARDLDHRYYEYPGLFFYLLYPVLGIAGFSPPAVPAAYLAVRGVVATFGVASVAAVYLLGRRLSGVGAGLLGALLLAASPLDVSTAHEVRPDVVLQFFVLLALLAFRRIGEEPSGDAWAGLAAGAATAVKFTGVLLAPSYVAARLISPGRRFQGVLLAAGVGAIAFVLFTPYALLNLSRYESGVGVQWAAHYAGKPEGHRFWEHASYYVVTAASTLGTISSLLLVVGVGVAARRWRSWIPLLLHPIVTVAVLSTADLRFGRHLVPTMGLLALLAGTGGVFLARGRRVLLWVVAAAAVAVPLVRSARYAASISRPGTWDRTVDWVAAHAPEGTRILTTEPDMGLDRRRFEVIPATGSPAFDRILAGEVDLVVTGHHGHVEIDGLAPAFTASPESPEEGFPTTVERVLDAVRPVYHPVPLAEAHLNASENAEGIEAIRDGNDATTWSTHTPQHPGQWVQVDLASPVLLARVELVLGKRTQRYARNLHLLVSEDGAHWTRVRVLPGRPAPDEQGDRHPSEVLLFEPVRARSIRLVQMAEGERRWGFAEINLAAVPHGS